MHVAMRRARSSRSISARLHRKSSKPPTPSAAGTHVCTSLPAMYHEFICVSPVVDHLWIVIPYWNCSELLRITRRNHPRPYFICGMHHDFLEAENHKWRAGGHEAWKTNHRLRRRRSHCSQRTSGHCLYDTFFNHVFTWGFAQDFF
jgi:hypothetical protein